MTLVHARALLRIEPWIKIKPEVKEITTIALFFSFILRVKLIAMIKPRKIRYVLQLCDTLILIKTVSLSVLVSNCFVPRENNYFQVYALPVVLC